MLPLRSSKTFNPGLSHPLSATGIQTQAIIPSIKNADGFWQTPRAQVQITTARRHFLRLCETQSIVQGPDLFEKLVANTRCLDHSCFEQGLQNLAHAVKKFVGQNPYCFVRTKSDRSENLIFDLLPRFGFKIAPYKILDYGALHYLGWVKT